MEYDDGDDIDERDYEADCTCTSKLWRIEDIAAAVTAEWACPAWGSVKFDKAERVRPHADNQYVGLRMAAQTVVALAVIAAVLAYHWR